MRTIFSSCVFFAAVLVAFPAIVNAQNQPAVTVEPASGPYGTAFQPKISGLAPGTSVAVVMRFPDGHEEPGPTLAAAPQSGQWQPKAWQSVPEEPSGQYTIVFKNSANGTVLGTGNFTVQGGDDSVASPGAATAGQPAELPKAGGLPDSVSPFIPLGLILILSGFGLRVGKTGRGKLRG